MPLEGHWKRQTTPLRQLTPRERNVVLAGLGVTIVAVVALILAAGTSTSRPGPGPGCIRVVVAGRVGGEPVNACGAEASAVCARAARFDDPRAREIVEACRDAKIRPSSSMPAQR